METVYTPAIKEEPVDTSYDHALHSYGYNRHDQTQADTIGERMDQRETVGREFGTKKNKLINLLFGTDSGSGASADMDNNYSPALNMRDVTNINGSNVNIKSEIIDKEYEQSLSSQTPVSKGNNSALFSLLVAGQTNQSNSTNSSNLPTSHKKLSSLLAGPPMNQASCSIQDKMFDFKTNNMPKKSSTLLQMLASPSVPFCSQGNNPIESHLPLLSHSEVDGSRQPILNEPQNTTVGSQLDATIKMMLEKTDAPSPSKNSCNKGLLELLNKGRDYNRNVSRVPEKTSTGRLDATINMLMSRPSAHAPNSINDSINRKNIENHDINHILSSKPSNMNQYDSWINEVSTMLTDHAFKTEPKEIDNEYDSTQSVRSRETSIGHQQFQDSQDIDRNFDHSDTRASQKDENLPNVVVDSQGAMFITVNPNPVDYSTNKRVHKGGHSFETEPSFNVYKKPLEHLKAELLKPSHNLKNKTQVPEIKSQGSEVKSQVSEIKYQGSEVKSEGSEVKQNISLSSLLRFKPLTEDQSEPLNPIQPTNQSEESHNLPHIQDQQENTFVDQGYDQVFQNESENNAMDLSVYAEGNSDFFSHNPLVIQIPGQKPEFWIYKCKQCNKTFRHAGTLKVHERAHSFEKEEFKCNICGKVCTAAGYLAIHMRTHSSDKSVKNEGIFKCHICSDIFNESENLLIHLRMHSGEKLFKCEICENGFTRKTQLIIHMRIHTGEKPYKCEICGKTFRQSNGLNLHLTTHTDNKPYKCEICNGGFGRKAHYEKHMRKHRGERPFVCNECGKGFTDKFNLSMHIKIHNKEKDHICGICNKGYNQATHLKNHMRFHTGETGYKCAYCPKVVEFKRELYQHYRDDHPEKYAETHKKKSRKRTKKTEMDDTGNTVESEMRAEVEYNDGTDEDDDMESDDDSADQSGGDNEYCVENKDAMVVKICKTDFKDKTSLVMNEASENSIVYSEVEIKQENVEQEDSWVL